MSRPPQRFEYVGCRFQVSTIVLKGVFISKWNRPSFSLNYVTIIKISTGKYKVKVALRVHCHFRNMLKISVYVLSLFIP